MPGRRVLEVDYMHAHMACLDNRDFCKMSLDDYAVSYYVGICWALRLSQVLAFTECLLTARQRNLEVVYASVIMKEIYSGN